MGNIVILNIKNLRHLSASGGEAGQPQAEKIKYVDCRLTQIKKELTINRL